MISPPVRSRPGRWIGAVIGVAVAGAAVAVWRASTEARRPLGGEFEYDVKRFERSRPDLIDHEEALAFDTGLESPRALAVGPEDHIYVAGEGRLAVFRPDGSNRRELELPGMPSCLAVAAGGAIYVGLTDHVEVFGPDGVPQASWPRPEEGALLTSIAVKGDEVYVADARHRTVWRHRVDGQALGQIEAQAMEDERPVFVVPSPYFDLAVGPDGLLRVVNPGRHRIELYHGDGTPVSAWGETSYEPEGFAGCCNPAHIAMLPDGRCVTSEKGLLRVKIYDAEGRFESLVADASSLGENTSPREVAADSRGRVLVLDTPTRSVRVFVKTGQGEENTHEP